MKKQEPVSANKFPVNTVIIILVILVYLCFFLSSQVKAVSLKITESAQFKKKIQDIEKEWRNIDALKKKISNLSEKIDYYEKKLPNEKEIPAVLEYLSAAARKINVRITEIKPIELEQLEDSGKVYYSVPNLIKAECGYHQLGRFLNAIEKADRFMKISDIKITSKPQKNNIHDVQLIVVTYVMRK